MRDAHLPPWIISTHCEAVEFGAFVRGRRSLQFTGNSYCFLQFTSKIMRTEGECVNELSIKSLVESFMSRFSPPHPTWRHLLRERKIQFLFESSYF